MDLIYGRMGFALVMIMGCGNHDKVQELLNHGDEAQQSKDYEQAIKDYSEAIQLDSNSATAYVDRGSIFTITGEFNKAVKDLDEAS